MDDPQEKTEFEAEEIQPDSPESSGSKGPAIEENEMETPVPIENDTDSSMVADEIDEKNGVEEEAINEKASDSDVMSDGDPEKELYEDELLDDGDASDPEAPDTEDEKPPDIDFILNLPLELTVEYGRAHKKIAKLVDLQQGTVIELSKLKGEPVDIMANDKLIAKGEVVVENDKYAIRITEIVSRLERIKRL